MLWVIIWHKESLIDYMTDFLAQGSVPSVWLHILWLVTPKLATWKRNWRPGVTMILYLMRLTFRLKGFSSIFHYDRLLLSQIARLMTRWCSTNSIEEWLGVFIMLLLHHLARGPQDGLAKMTLRPNRCCDSHSPFQFERFNATKLHINWLPRFQDVSGKVSRGQWYRESRTLRRRS